jgi:KUP system potassium uptake protein
MTPTVFIQFLSKFVVTPRISVFFHLRPLSTPSVPPENRYTVLRTVIPNCYRLIIRHGYTDEVVTEDLGLLVYEQLRSFIIREGGTGVGGNGDGGKGDNGGEGSSTDPSSSSNPESSASSTRTPGDGLGGREIDGAGGVAGRLAETQRAYETQVLYIVGKEQMRIKNGTRIWRRVALNAFLWLRDNTRSKMASMRIPTDSLVEVGFIKEI